MAGKHLFQRAWDVLINWVCPPPLPDVVGIGAELQRQRISRFLPAMLVIDCIANVASIPTVLERGASFALLQLSLPLPFICLCLVLCHRRQALFAAWCYISSIFIGLVIANWSVFDFEHFMKALLSVPTFLPICVIGILISPRACWIATGLLCAAATVLGIVAFGADMGVLADLFTTYGLLFSGTAVIALGAQGLHRAVREMDRTQEMFALNEQLAAYNAEIAHREADALMQRRFMDAIVDGIAPDAFFVLDHQGVIVRCNAAFDAIFRFAPATAVGHQIAHLPGAPMDFIDQLRLMRQKLRVHGQVRTETIFTNAAGHQFVMESHAVALPGMNITVIIARDVSARLAMEARLRYALRMSDNDRSLLGTVFDIVQDALVVVDANERVILRNAGYRALFPLPSPMRTDTLASHITAHAMDGTLLLPEQWPHRRLLRGETISNPQLLRLKVANQPQRVVLVKCVPFHHGQSHLSAVVMTLSDVTQEMRQHRNVEATAAIAHACAAATEERAVASEALRVLLKDTGAALGSVIVRDPLRTGFARPLSFQFEHQIPQTIESEWYAAVTSWPIAADSPIPGLRVLATEQTYFGPHEVPATFDYAGFRLHALTVPLWWEGAVIGALSVQYWPEDVEMIDQELIQLAADEVGMALHRARLYDEARRLALIDPLTGFSNHRALQDVVKQELATGTAQSLPVSVIMLDIDHFRQFNEAHGHDRGDEALRSVAKAISAAVRPGDTAARFSGEEFAVVLPATDADMADTLAVRIQETIAAQTLFVDAEGAPVRLTVSAGHATFPIHASAPASLLKAADLALYAAKRGGRNCVVAYTVTLIEDNAHLLPMSIGDSVTKMGEISLPTGTDIETIQAFITAIDLRDGYTAAHSEGVSRYAVAIASEMNLPSEYVEALRLGGLVHDVGKIGVSDHVLRKPGKLDPDEWQQMQQHTVMGEAILRPLEQLRQLLPLVRWHHERLDGSGYPDGLKGDEIPLLVRILSVADVFEAFTAERPYHPGRPAIEGLRLLQREAAGGKMDPYVVEVFEGILISQGLVEQGVRGEQDLVLAA